MPTWQDNIRPGEDDECLRVLLPQSALCAPTRSLSCVVA
jgi:hypothetical protein